MAKKLTTNDTGIVIDENGKQTSISYTDKDLGSNFQYLQNPTTKKVIAVGQDTFKTIGQDLSSLGGFVPVDKTVFNKPTINKDGLTMEQANDPKYWKDGKYVGYDTTGGSGETEINTYAQIDASGVKRNADGSVWSPLPAFGSVATTPTSTYSGAFSSMSDYESKLAAKKAELEASALSKKEKQRAIIESQYAQPIQEATQYREDVTEATKGQFATDRRASTAALSFVDVRRNEAQKQINKLVSMKEEALANLDVTTQEKLDTEIKNWQDYELKLSSYFRDIEQQNFSNKMAELGYELDLKQFEETQKTSLLNRERTQYEIDKERMNYAMSKINNLISGNIDISKIDAKDKSSYENYLGLPSGGFDTFYAEMKDLNDLSKTGNIVDLADKQTTLLSKIDKGTTITINGQTFQGLKGETAETTADYKDWILMGKPEGDYYTYKNKKKLTESGLPNTVMTQIDSLVKSFDSNQIVKDFITVQNKKESVSKIIDSGVGGPGDLALVFEFMKALDPNSVVRESEYETASKSGNIFAGWAAKFNGYLKAEGGFLPDNVKQAFKQITAEKYNVSKKQYENLFNERARQINNKLAPYGQSDGVEYLTQYDYDKVNEDVKNVNSTEDIWSGMDSE